MADVPAGAVSLLLCRRIRRLLHGALHLSSGNPAQLAVPKTGQRVPGRRVRERRGPAHEDHQRSDHQPRVPGINVAVAEPDPWSLSHPRSSVSHVRGTQPAVGGLVHPSESPLILHLAQVSL